MMKDKFDVKFVKIRLEIKFQFIYWHKNIPMKPKTAIGNSSGHRRKQSEGLWSVNRIKKIFGNQRGITKLPCKMH